ncbi:MAG: hypothetical protein R3328_04340 [Planococcaceae bacterium]|nr:hypothetical protein [Planococcaceae bacterium]
MNWIIIDSLLHVTGIKEKAGAIFARAVHNSLEKTDKTAKEVTGLTNNVNNKKSNASAR